MEAKNNIEVQKHFKEIYRSANRVIEIALLGYFLFGLGIAFFYDTWLIALTVGPLALSMYAVAKWLFPTTSLNQYIAGLVFDIFMAQFIYQMHGLFEMHFFAFIGTILLISYQNWKAFIPLTISIVVHHAAFAYLQFVGYENVYFTQLDYMSLSTFIFHVGLAAVIIALCGYWAFDFRKRTVKSLQINLKLQGQLTHTDQNIAFAAEIANGNLLVEKDREQSDELGRSLINMQDKLREARQREQREKFLNVGLAEVGDILRKNVHSLEDLSDKVIAYLVKYLNANQGGLFIANDRESKEETQTLTMTACYAYDKKKYLEKTIKAGQGLVGQAYLEKQTIHLKQVPQNYINITSGLGEATPNNLLLTPLIVNETIEGIIEIASFKEFNQDAIEFLEKVGESIASMISSSKSSSRMARLLEASKTSTEELRATEEEMRQNNEELQAIQEEMARKEKEQVALLNTVQQAVGMIELDMSGYIRQINPILAQQLGYDQNELTDEVHTKLFSDQEISRGSYPVFWEKISRGHSCQTVLELCSKRGETLSLPVSGNPLSEQKKIVLLCWLGAASAVTV
uniref:GAF domain-containing protein n=1 Tax=Roseihalotalea indica TaxID=2867963 RepID=A0AA49JK44_9BACT|nr:GAF domain-containing protein [Tunicatimonas sp. TK19036]